MGGFSHRLQHVKGRGWGVSGPIIETQINPIWGGTEGGVEQRPPKVD